MESQGETISMENGTATSAAHNMNNNGEEKLDDREKLTFTVTENPPVHITTFYALQVGQIFWYHPHPKEGVLDPFSVSGHMPFPGGIPVPGSFPGLVPDPFW